MYIYTSLSIYIHIYIHREMYILSARLLWETNLRACSVQACSNTPNLPTNITYAKIAWLKLSGKFSMGLGIPPLRIRILLESNPLKSRIYTRSPSQDSPSQDFRQGLGCSEIVLFIGSG